jgi:hypothetical protein
MSIEVAAVTPCRLKSLNEWLSERALAICHLICHLRKQSVHLHFPVQVHNHCTVLLVPRYCPQPPHLMRLNPVHISKQSAPKLARRYLPICLINPQGIPLLSVERPLVEVGFTQESSRRTLSISASRKRSRYRPFPLELTPQACYIPLLEGPVRTSAYYARIPPP